VHGEDDDVKALAQRLLLLPPPAEATGKHDQEAVWQDGKHLD